MGTNFYLQAKQPREYYPQYHIGKRSAGWKPSFETSPMLEQDFQIDREVPRQLDIASVDDIKKYYDSGKYFIVDEYGKIYDWDAFVENVLEWCPDGKSHLGWLSEYHKDNKGYEFFGYPFS